DDASISTKTLHANRGNLLAGQFRKHAALEAAEVRVETVQRKLTGIEGESQGQHAEMDLRIFVPGEADVAHLAVALGALERFHNAARREMARWIVVVHAFVDLPE